MPTVRWGDLFGDPDFGDPITTEDMHHILGIAADEYLSHGTGRGGSREFIGSCVQAREIRRPWPNDRNVWASVTVFPELPRGKRGSEFQIRRVPALVADLDITTEGIKEDSGLESMRDCYDVAVQVSEALGTLPAIAILSGHGLQTVWPMAAEDADVLGGSDDPRRARLKLASTMLTAELKRAAKKRGGAADSCSDLTRVIRTPFTFNVKDPANPVLVTAHRWPGYDGGVVDLNKIVDPATVLHRGYDGVMRSNPEGWPYLPSNVVHCIYAVTAIERELAKPMSSYGRHKWMFRVLTRIEEMRRGGHLTEEQYNEYHARTVAEFRHALQFTLSETSQARDEHSSEVERTARDAIFRAASLTEDEMDKAGGKHTHADDVSREELLTFARAMTRNHA